MQERPVVLVVDDDQLIQGLANRLLQKAALNPSSRRVAKTPWRCLKSIITIIEL